MNATQSLIRTVSTEHTLKTSKITRQSNMELLRIVAMSMIVIGHFLVHGITKKQMSPIIYDFITTYCAIGVNLFFLISGYFRIKASLKGIFKLIYTIFIFDCINILLLVAVGETVSLSEYLNTVLFPISKSSYWFIHVYLFLIVCAPLINIGIDKLPLKQLRALILVFSLLTVYSCGLGHNLSNNNGYTFLQGVYMYCLAAYLKRDNYLMEHLNGIKCLISAFLLLTLGAIIIYFTHIVSVTIYNSFINIASAALVFMYFSKLELKSRAINGIAVGALGCYLLQDGIFGLRYLYGLIHEIYHQESILYSIGYLSSMFIVFWICSIPISNIINKTFSKFINPICGKLTKYIELKLS